MGQRPIVSLITLSGDVRRSDLARRSPFASDIHCVGFVLQQGQPEFCFFHPASGCVLFGQAFGQQGRYRFVETLTVGFSQRLNLLHQVAIDFHGKRDQTLGLVEFALIAARYARIGRATEAVRRTGMFHLTCYFQAFVSV